MPSKNRWICSYCSRTRRSSLATQLVPAPLFLVRFSSLLLALSCSSNPQHVHQSGQAPTPNKVCAHPAAETRGSKIKIESGRARERELERSWQVRTATVAGKPRGGMGPEESHTARGRATTPSSAAASPPACAFLPPIQGPEFQGSGFGVQGPGFRVRGIGQHAIHQEGRVSASAHRQAWWGEPGNLTPSTLNPAA